VGSAIARDYPVAFSTAAIGLGAAGIAGGLAIAGAGLTGATIGGCIAILSIIPALSGNEQDTKNLLTVGCGIAAGGLALSAAGYVVVGAGTVAVCTGVGVGGSSAVRGIKEYQRKRRDLNYADEPEYLPPAR
jgi:hypothetical protein